MKLRVCGVYVWFQSDSDVYRGTTVYVTYPDGNRHRDVAMRTAL